MASDLRCWLAAVAVLVATAARPTAAAEPGEQPAAPAQPTPGESLPAPAPVADRPAAYVLPAPGWPVPQFASPDPFLERPYAAGAGWFVNAEANVLTVHLRNQLSVPVTNPITGGTDNVQFPGNKLDLTVSPQVELGYRFPDGCGELLFSYRFLATSGTDQVVTGPDDAFQGVAAQQGRLDYNIFDLVYMSREYALDPDWAMRWGFGGRVATLYFDSRLSFQDPGTAAGNVLSQAESNQFHAYGVHAALDLSRKLPAPGWAVFGRIEGAGLVGRLTQTGTEVVASGPGGPPSFAETRYHLTIGNPSARFVAGLSYEPFGWHHSRLMVGYEYEVWWEIGRVAANNSEAQLETSGLFLRAELNF
jgi:hypothetical protein